MQTHMPGYNEEHAAKVKNQSTVVAYLHVFHSFMDFVVCTQTHGCAVKCTSFDKEFGSSLGADILPSDEFVCPKRISHTISMMSNSASLQIHHW